MQISLKAARVNAGFTQDQAAKMLKISKATLISWEKGKIIPSNIAIMALSEIYNIPTDNIFLPEKLTKERKDRT